jgi:hypothetical protein
MMIKAIAMPNLRQSFGAVFRILAKNSAILRK